MGGITPNPDLEFRIQNHGSGAITPSRLTEPIFDFGLQFDPGRVLLTTAFSIQNYKCSIEVLG